MDQVASRAVLVQLGEHDQLFGQQDPARRFYLLLSGQMKLFRLALEGNEKVIEIVSPGSTFAEALMFLENPTRLLLEYGQGVCGEDRGLIVRIVRPRDEW